MNQVSVSNMLTTVHKDPYFLIRIPSNLPLSNDGAKRQSAVAVGGIGPAGRWQGEELVAEVDEGLNILPVVEEVVFQFTGRVIGEQGYRSFLRINHEK